MIASDPRLPPRRALFWARLALWITAILATGIAFGTLISGGGAVASLGDDKTQHLLAFAVLVLPGIALRPRWTVALVIFALSFGAAIELVQPFVGRQADLADWIADAKGVGIGAVLGLALAAVIRR